jgi:predicted dehydrogenase
MKHDSKATTSPVSRRRFIQSVSVASASVGLVRAVGAAEKKPIFGLERVPDEPDAHAGWKSVSDRKIRVGLIGHGLCGMAASFGFEQHPNVEVVAVSDLFPDRCEALAKHVKCGNMYSSGEEMIKHVKDNKLDAICIATDPPSHVPLSILALDHGLHVSCCVPAVFGSLDDADKLMGAVKRSGLKYMMMETSAYYKGNHAMRKLYQADALGRVLYTEGEYWHYSAGPMESYNGWRLAPPPMWYPTHSNAYYICVTGGTFTEVSCMGVPSHIKMWMPKNNRYNNAFATEIALFRTNEGGMARMSVGYDAPGMDENVGRIRGEKGAYNGRFEGDAYFGKYEGLVKDNDLPSFKRPPLPPTVHAGGHDGSEGYLMDEFITAILQDRKPLVDIAMSLNLTVSGIVAHQSALKDGELLKIPQYKL